MNICKGILKKLLCFFTLILSFFAVQAKVDTVVVQLKWKHQFQFAGYYAAQFKGFYESENLYVKFKESDKEVDFSGAVLNKEAHFAIAGSEIILDYVNNKPVVVLASIFQHSPYVIISKKEKKITKPTDLAGKNVYAAKGQGLFLLYTLLKSEGIPLSSLNIETPFRNPSLEDKGVDAITAYRSGKIVELQAMGQEISTIDPADYGVDFYGDVLLTSKEEVNQDPDKIERFLKASLNGWKYALQNPNEISEYILTLPGVKERNLDKTFLLREAEILKSIIRPDLVEIGHMNRGRWENILKVYEELGVIKNAENVNLDDFIYHPVEKNSKYINRLIVVSSILLIIALFFLIRYVLIKHNLRKTQEKVILANIKEKLSEETINTILDHSGIILWNWNVRNGEFIAYGGEGNKDFETKNINSVEDFKMLLHFDTFKNFEVFIDLLPDSFAEEVLIKIKDTYEWYMLRVQVRERDLNNNPISFLGLLIDISNLKKKEENLDKLSHELKKTNSELQKFAYITSHNLRAPVVNLGSLIEFYDYSATDAKVNSEIVEKISISVNQLRNTLEDLINVVSGKSEIVSFETLNIENEFDNLIKSIDPTFSTIEYNFSQITHIEYPLEGFKTIFINLLLNCFKYRNPLTPLAINIKSFYVEDYIAIQITDNGLGIDLDKNREKMFGLYQRFHPEIEGRGIGLFIVKSQIENLDGKIEVESKMNLGATFTVFFRKRPLR